LGTEKRIGLEGESTDPLGFEPGERPEFTRRRYSGFFFDYPSCLKGGIMPALSSKPDALCVRAYAVCFSGIWRHKA
jgi:hypothetical protein